MCGKRENKLPALDLLERDKRYSGTTDLSLFGYGNFEKILELKHYFVVWKGSCLRKESALSYGECRIRSG